MTDFAISMTMLASIAFVIGALTFGTVLVTPAGDQPGFKVALLVLVLALTAAPALTLALLAH